MIVISCCVYYFQDINNHDSEIAIDSEGFQEEEMQPPEIFVDISGEVLEPGFIELPFNSKVFEAINVAGGLSEKANIRVINVVQTLTDGEKVFIPSQEEANQIKGLIPVKDIFDDRGEPVYVSIIGAIDTPCVVIASSECRVIDALDAAGGPTIKADMNRVNLAERLIDGMNLYIPKKGEDNKTLNQVNINTASQLELQQLSGIGEVLASEIVKYRDENGFFKKSEDIMKVPGIGQGKFNNIKEDVCIY